MSSYSDRLKDPRWQKKRLEVFQRDGFKCLCCNDGKETLHVHHLIYSKGNPWDAPMDTLESLCETCHEWREDFNGYWGRSLVGTRQCQQFMILFHPLLSGNLDRNEKYSALKVAGPLDAFDKCFCHKFGKRSPIIQAGLEALGALADKIDYRI